MQVLHCLIMGISGVPATKHIEKSTPRDSCQCKIILVRPKSTNQPVKPAILIYLLS